RLRADDLARVGHRARTRRTLRQRVHGFHAGRHLAPDRVLLIEEAGVVEANEELAVGGVRIVGARHRAHAAHMWLSAELLLQVWLRGAAGAVEIPAVTALRHEALDNAVKRDSVIEALV